MDFFSAKGSPEESHQRTPLALRVRPRTLDDFVGQEALVGKNAPLRSMIEGDKLCSMMFWGPAGSGKTTLASIIANMTQADFVSLSAVTAGLKDVRSVIEQAKLNRAGYNRRTILFIDEIHRFNKAQQDAFLPFVEDGTIVLIGATTENPSFSIISPLLSRCRVFVLERLSDEHLKTILRRAAEDADRGFGKIPLSLAEGTFEVIIRLSDGDARRALNLLETAVMLSQRETPEQIHLTPQVVLDIAQRQQLIYDKEGEEHYNLISAFHKSLRGSDVDAALYWLGRMLASGEDPLYLARRMIRFASEDIGNADPQALAIAMAAKQAYESLGSPEGELALAQAAIYLATSPKSNAVYEAFNRVQGEIQKSGSLPVPFFIRNAPTSLMKSLGYGKGYVYDHEAEGRFAGQEHLPPDLKGRKFYQPGEFGFEREIKRRLEWWEKQKKQRDGDES
jgi:putative ATPase